MTDLTEQYDQVSDIGPFNMHVLLVLVGSHNNLSEYIQQAFTTTNVSVHVESLARKESYSIRFLHPVVVSLTILDSTNLTVQHWDLDLKRHPFSHQNKTAIVLYCMVSNGMVSYCMYIVYIVKIQNYTNARIFFN